MTHRAKLEASMACRRLRLPVGRCSHRAALLVLAVVVLGGIAAAAQQLPDAAEMQRQIQAVATQLTETQQQLERSQHEIQRLQAELNLLQRKLAVTPLPAQPLTTTAATSPEPPQPTPADMQQQQQQEQQQVLAAQIKLHEQTKVESVSRYPVRVTGLLLMNTFLNRGVVDQIDLPSVALRPTSGTSDSSFGAGFRQTTLGLQARGPRLGSARTSAEVNVDFFGGLPYTSYGTSSGVLRLRTASIDVDWKNDSVQLGFTHPLISPLSPTSYATSAEPAMAWAGNLWTWAPQARYEHRFALARQRHVGIEAGIWDAPSSGYNFNALLRTPSAAELSGQPAYEARVSLAGDGADDAMQLGFSGYFGREHFAGYDSFDTYAFTTDWRLPFSHRFEWSGEAYRGRGLGGLGGGVYKDVISGTDPATGLPDLKPLHAAGGWTQIKLRFGRTLETNGAFGIDQGFAADFHAIVQPATASPAQLRARNRMVVANLIFSPKTYLILSPEFRRIWTWPITGPASTANLFTLSAAYRF
jgi:hypothetical protein